MENFAYFRKELKKCEVAKTFVDALFAQAPWGRLVSSQWPVQSVKKRDAPDVQESLPEALFNTSLTCYPSVLTQNLDVLFLFDYPRHLDATSENFLEPAKFELFSKIVMAMQLPEHSFVATYLFASQTQYEEWQQKAEQATGQMNQRLIELQRVMRVWQPRCLISFGPAVSNILLKKDWRLSEVHGQFFPWEYAPGHMTQVVPLFNLDYLMINVGMKKTAWLDFQKVIKYLQESQ